MPTPGTMATFSKLAFRSPSRRRAWLGGALVALAIVPTVATAQAQTSPPELVEHPVPWQVAGVGPGGRSLLVAHLGPNGCSPGNQTLRAELTSATDSAIAVRVVSTSTKVDPDQGVICPATPLMNVITTVPVGLPVRGQVITGPLRTADLMNGRWLFGSVPVPGGIAYRTAMPSLKGLRVPDAMGLLTALEVDRASIRFPGARRGYVRAQFPRAGVLLDPEATAIRLRVT